MAQVDIESVLKEERVFEPRKEFSAQAHIGSVQEYEKLYQQAQDDPEGFWARMAKELDWFKPWE
jgi:acetyl-CoA synthetase